MDGSGSCFLHHFVNQSDISESAPGHHLIVSSSASIRVEINRLYSSFFEVPRSGRVQGYLTSRRDMISSDGVAQVQQTIRGLDVLNWLRCFLEVLKERRVVDVGATLIPFVTLSFFYRKFIPSLVRGLKVFVVLKEHVFVDVLFNEDVNLI
jgi:hypothetical protein